MTRAAAARLTPMATSWLRGTVRRGVCVSGGVVARARCRWSRGAGWGARARGRTAAKAADGGETENAVTFADVGVGKHLARALERSGIVTPSIAQRAAMPAIERGKTSRCSRTRFGKALAYLLPIINEMMDEERGTIRADVGTGVRALVVAPSQELAMQIVRQVERILGDLGRKITQQAIGGATRDDRRRRYERRDRSSSSARPVVWQSCLDRESCRRTVCERSSWTRQMICWRATLDETWRESANTRKGRAGRETDGHRERDAETRDVGCVLVSRAEPQAHHRDVR